MASYRTRVVDAELSDTLHALGAVLIEGPKACGKTRTAREVARSEILLDQDENARRAIHVDPAIVLEGPTPRLIDEWQVEPAIWNEVRRTVDDRRQAGQFILTGSAVPPDDETRHSGAGRITRIAMRPMTLFESGHSTGQVSLAALLQSGEAAAADPGLGVSEIARACCVGGWPAYQELDSRSGMRAVRAYLDEIRRVDVNRVGAARRDPERVMRLLRSLARNVATYASMSTLAADTGGPDGPLRRDTVSDYLDVLTRLRIVEDQPPWAPHLRSRHVLRDSPKRHFIDPSLAIGALTGSPETLLRDLRYFGFVFESLVVRDLRVYAQASDAEVLQYKDTDLEIDAVVRTVEGRWAAFEVKLGTDRIDEGARNLMSFAKRIDTEVVGPPAAMAVITARGYGYVRDDGIAVIPIAALGP